MKDKRTLALQVMVFIVTLGVLWFAMIGALYLFATDKSATEVQGCDRIQAHDEQLWCMASMEYEDDNIMVIRGEGSYDD